MTNAYPIYDLSAKTNLLGKFDLYLDTLSNTSIPEELDLGAVQTFDDILNGDGDPLENYNNATINNANIKKNNCPILNPQDNLPNVENNPLPQVPDLSFLKQFDLPPPAIAALFGAYGRGLILAAQNYAAEQIKTQLVRISQGDECVIEIASKIQNGIQTAAQVQYLLAQPVVTPIGPGAVLPI